MNIAYKLYMLREFCVYLCSLLYVLISFTEFNHWLELIDAKHVDNEIVWSHKGIYRRHNQGANNMYTCSITCEQCTCITTTRLHA